MSLFDKISQELGAKKLEKKARIAQASEGKQFNLDPLTKAAQDVAIVDADTLKIQEAEKNLRLGATPGYAVDAYETSLKRKQTNPEAWEGQRRHLAKMSGVDPEAISDDDIMRAGQRQTGEVMGRIGDENVSITPTGEIAPGDRPVVTAQTESGTDLGEMIASDPSYPGFTNPLNPKGQREATVEGKLSEPNAFSGPKSIGQAAGDPLKGFLIGTPEILATTFTETLSMIPGVDLGGATQKVNDLADRSRSRWLSGKEQKQQEQYNQRIKAYDDTRPQRIADYQREGYGDTAAEALATADEVGYTLKDLWNNPGRALNMAAQSAGTFIGGAAVARGALKVASKKLAKEFGDDWKSNPAAVAKAKKMTVGAGFTAGTLMEASMASGEMYNKVMDEDIEVLKATSEVFNDYTADGMSDKEAQKALARDAREMAYGMMAVLAGTTSAVTGTPLVQSKIFTRIFDEDKLVQRGLGRKLLEGAGTATGAAIREAPEEFVQSGGEAKIQNTIEEMLLGGPGGWGGVGSAAAAGAASGAVTAGGASNVSSAVKAGIKAVKEGGGPRVNRSQAPDVREGKVSYTKHVDSSKISPEVAQRANNLGMDIQIISGHREGDPRQHGKGEAIDINTKGWDDERKKELVRRLHSQGFSGVMTYNDYDHIHADIGKYKSDFHPMHSPKGGTGSGKYMDQAPQWFKDVTAELQGKAPGSQVGKALGGVPNTPRARVINTAITRSAYKNDLPPVAEGYLRAMAEIESSWGENETGPRIGIDTSGDPAQHGKQARGPFQFMPGTAQQYGLSDPHNANASAQAAGQMLKENHAAIRKAMPDISDEKAWHLAAIAHHAGLGNVLKGNLGPNSKEYSEKLGKALPKYFGSGADKKAKPGSVENTAEEIRQTAVTDKEEPVSRKARKREKKARETGQYLDAFTEIESKISSSKVKKGDINQLLNEADTYANAAIVERIESLKIATANGDKTTADLVRSEINEIADRRKTLKALRYAQPATEAVERTDSFSSPDNYTPDDVTVVQAALEEGIELENLDLSKVDPKIRPLLQAAYDVGQLSYDVASEKLWKGGEKGPSLMEHKEQVLKAMKTDKPNEKSMAYLDRRLGRLKSFVKSQQKKLDKDEARFSEVASAEQQAYLKNQQNELPMLEDTLNSLVDMRNGYAKAHDLPEIDVEGLKVVKRPRKTIKPKAAPTRNQEPPEGGSAPSGPAPSSPPNTPSGPAPSEPPGGMPPSEWGPEGGRQGPIRAGGIKPAEGASKISLKKAPEKKPAAPAGQGTLGIRPATGSSPGFSLKGKKGVVPGEEPSPERPPWEEENQSKPRIIAGHKITFLPKDAPRLKGAIALSTKDGILAQEGITQDQVLQYLEGHLSASPTARQKAVVSAYMQDEFGVDLVQVIKGMSEQDLRKFIIYHEISHVENNDRSKYYEDTKQTIAGDKADLKNKFLADSAIRIEARANMDALKKLKLWNPKPKTADLKAKTKVANEKVLKGAGEQQTPTPKEVTAPIQALEDVMVSINGEQVNALALARKLTQENEILSDFLDKCK